MALGRYQFTTQDEFGNFVAGAAVEVRAEATGALVSLFADRDGSVGLPNPTQTDVEGFCFFHVGTALYRIVVTSGADVRTFRDVLITAGEQAAAVVTITAAGDVVVGAETVLRLNKTVPQITNVSLPAVPRELVIIDMARNAGTYPITLTPTGGKTINGQASIEIALDGAQIRLFGIAGDDDWHAAVSS